MQMKPWSFWTLILVLLMTLTGCATTNSAAKRTGDGLDLDLSPAANEGFAVLRVVSLRPVSLLNPKWQQVNLTSKAGRADMLDITVPSNAFFGGKYYATESLYFAKLPVDRYEISGFGSTGPGPGLIPALLASDSAKATTTPAFRIEAGRLANLGTIVYAPEIEKEQPAQTFLLGGPVGQKYALDALLAESRQTKLGVVLGGGWQTEVSPEDEQKALTQARSQVSHFYFRATNESLSGGSHLGQIARRTGTNQWSFESVDSLSTVFTTATTKDGRIVAGGEHGTYFAKSAQGAWKTYRLPKDMGRVVYMEPHGDTGVLLVSIDSGVSKYWIRDSFTVQEETPKEVAKLPTMPELILSTPDELITPGNIPGIMRKTEITRFNKSNHSVTKQGHDFWVRDWQHFPGNEILMTRMNNTSLYRSRSTDGGRSWAHEQNASGASNYWLTPRIGYSMDYKPGFSTVTNNLMKTSDGGTTWIGAGTPLVTPHFAGNIVYADATEVVVQVLGLIYSTTDDGKTWARIFPPKQ